MLSGRSANNSKHAFSPYTFISSARFFLIFSGARGDNAPVFFLSVYNSRQYFSPLLLPSHFHHWLYLMKVQQFWFSHLLLLEATRRFTLILFFIKVRSISLTFFIITTIIKATFFVTKCTFWAMLLKDLVEFVWNDGLRELLIICFSKEKLDNNSPKCENL